MNEMTLPSDCLYRFDTNIGFKANPIYCMWLAYYLLPASQIKIWPSFNDLPTYLFALHAGQRPADIIGRTSGHF